MNKETITFKGDELVVEGWYVKEEPMVMYYKDGSGHPGSPSDFEINTITIDDIDVTDDYDDYIEDITDIVIEQIENY